MTEILTSQVVVGLAVLLLPAVGDNYVLYVMTRLFVYVLVALGLNLLTGYAGQVSLGHAASSRSAPTRRPCWPSGGSGPRCCAWWRPRPSPPSSGTCSACPACA
jgi:hypothetical protein